MSLIKHRPRIGLLLPPVLYPGQEVKAVVVLDARHEVAIESLDIHFQGKEWGYATTGMVGSVPVAQAMTKTLLSLGARLAGPRTLAMGRTELSCHFSLPEELPPSYRGRSSGAVYEIQVHAVIAWWPDARASFVARIEPRPQPPGPPEPVLSSTAPNGPDGNEPFLELSLADRNVASGSVLNGAVALGNVEQSRYTGLAVSLVGTEWVTIGRFRHTFGVARYTLDLAVDDAQEGASIPFSMRLPEVTPTTWAELWRLDWALEVRAKRLLARDLVASVALSVLPTERRDSDRSHTTRRRAAPSVGSARMHALWSSVAERTGWRLQDDELVQRVHAASLRIWREHRGRQGLYLVGEVGYESLGLGLDGGSRRGFRRFMTASPVQGSAVFEKQHYLVGRDPAQVEAFTEALGLWQMDPGAARLADIDDEHFVAELKNAGLSRRPLEALIELLTTLSRALPAARAAIPPPTSMHAQLGDWEALAQELDGTLERARMIVSGRFGVHRARVATEWSADGTAQRTLVELRPRSGLSGVEALGWSEQPLSPGQLPAELPRGVRRVLEELDGDALAVSVSPESLTLARPAPLGEPLSALGGLQMLERLLEEIGRGRGPYR